MVSITTDIVKLPIADKQRYDIQCRAAFENKT